MTINANTITQNFISEEVTVNTITAAGKTVDLICPINDCKGEVDVIVDNTTSESTPITLTVYGGVSPVKMEDTEYEVAAGKEIRISLSTAETMQADGKLKMKISSESSLALLGIHVLLFKRRYVTAH